MVGLPNVGSDTGVWGNELNAFLSVAHNSNGTINGPGSGLDSRYPQLLSTANVQYVSSAGNDSNTGTSPGTAKLTIPAAITALGSNPGTVVLMAGTIIDTAGIVVPASVSIEGPGSAMCTIDSRAATASISGTNAGGWYKQHFTGFAISHANNSNTGVKFITHSVGIAQCKFDDLHLQADGTASSDGIYIVDNLGGPTGVCNVISNSRIERMTGTGAVSGCGVNLLGAGNNASVNSNLIQNCAINFYSTGVYMQGQNNVLSKVIWNSCTTALHVQGDTITIDNFALGCYFDGSNTTKILLDDTSNTSVHHVLTISACINVTTPSQVTLGTNPSMIAFSMTGRNQAIGSSTPTSLNGSQAPAVYGGPTTGLVSYMGDQTFTSGRIIAAGSAYAGSANAVSNNGGVSAAIQNTSGTAFRVVTTSNGSSFTIVAAIDNSGNLTLPSGGLIAAAAVASGSPSAGQSPVYTGSALAYASGFAYTPADYGYLAWTSDPGLIQTGIILPTAGLSQITTVKIPYAMTVTKIVLGLATAGGTLTSGQCFCALYQGGNLLQTSTDRSAAWVGTGGVTTATITSQALTAGYAQIAIWANGTTLPSFARTASGAANYVFTGTNPVRFASGPGSLTTTAPSSLGTLTGDNSRSIWAALG